MKDPLVYVVHCVDVEGPMTETLDATWERIREEDGIALDLQPTRENLRRLQDGELGLPAGQAAVLAQKYSRYNLGYLEDWDAIDTAMAQALSRKARMALPDSFGDPYLFSWFIYDHYGFDNNPRFHAEGIHAVYDHYLETVLADTPAADGVYWHYHHPAASRNALEWSTNWHQNNTHEEILARRIIERGFFPGVFRAGGHIERNDLSFWLEQFIPFDFSCQRLTKGEDMDAPGMLNDWRGAPARWGFYHPDFYDYRRPGTMRRSLFRCLDIRTWCYAIGAGDFGQAFDQARQGEPTVLAVYNHDYRPMGPDMDHVIRLLGEVSAAYPDVSWKYATALEAARALTGHDDAAPSFEVFLDGNMLTIVSDADLFGPEPFLAVQEYGRFFRDNTTREGQRKWCYRFRNPQDVEAFGVAGNSPGGQTGVLVKRGRIA